MDLVLRNITKPSSIWIRNQKFTQRNYATSMILRKKLSSRKTSRDFDDSSESSDGSYGFKYIKRIHIYNLYQAANIKL